MREANSKLKVGNAPCSWGTLEFEGVKSESKSVPFNKMLDELVETGYTGTELGDWGYFPTLAEDLCAELKDRNLTLLGAFVPVAFRNKQAHPAGITEALKVARLMNETGELLKSPHRPFVILADQNGEDSRRIQFAGRIKREHGLSPEEWEIFIQGVSEVAHIIKEETGLLSLFHHHCAGFVETPEEIDHFLSLIKPELVNLVFDTGHYAFGANCKEPDIIGALQKFSDRISYVHFKDCDPGVADQSRKLGFDYFEAIKRGIFCELGQGTVDFTRAVEWLVEKTNHEWVLVEQDILPGMGDPRAAAQRNRDYLRKLGL